MKKLVNLTQPGLLLILTVLFYLPIARAESTLRILDVENNTRAIAALDQEIGHGIVEASLVYENSPTKKPDGFAVVLENKHSSEKLSRTVIDGVVRFVEVPEGTWTISTTRDGVLFTTLKIKAPGPLSIQSGAVGSIVSGKAVGAVAGSAAVPGILLYESSEGSRREPLSPSR